MRDDKLHDEAGRLASLARYRVLDTPREAPFDKITALVRSVLGVEISAVSLVDDRRQWFKSAVGLDASETPRCIAFCARTILQREPLVVEDARADTRFADNPLVTGAPHIASYLGVPLCTPDGYNLGSLCAIDSRPRRFTAQEIGLLQGFAALVLDELELRTIAHRDELTGVPMRRPWLIEAGRELERFQRYGRPFSVIIIDIDHFKQVNDRFGHPAGDTVLRAVSQACLAQLRPSDLLCRLGGEEFGVLLPETGSEEALAVAERLREALCALPPFAGGPASVSASFGAATAHAGTHTIDGLLAEADAALYAAKRAGRNRCMTAPAPGRAAA
jgi:diguanylate cyclase (GGDEF)-like protein